MINLRTNTNTKSQISPSSDSYNLNPSIDELMKDPIEFITRYIPYEKSINYIDTSTFTNDELEIYNTKYKNITNPCSEIILSEYSRQDVEFTFGLDVGVTIEDITND